MKLLVVHNQYRQPSGESEAFANLIRVIRQLEQDVVLYCRDNSEIGGLSRARRSLLIPQAFFSVRTWREIRALARQERPDVAIVQNVFPIISPSAYYALKSSRVPVIQLVYNYRFVCPDAHLYSHGEICERCVRGSHWNAVVRRCFGGSYGLSAWYAGIIGLHRRIGTFSRTIDRFVVPDHFAGTRLVAGGVPADRIRRIANPFFVEDYEPSYDVGEHILYVGRLTRQKGVLTLVRAMARTRGDGPPLLLVGHGQLAAGIEDLIDRLGLQDRVRLLGPKWGRHVRELIGRSRFVVVPSEWYDSLPMIVCQAFALAKPVVASAINGLPEYVEDGVDGLLFEPRNQVELASCIERLSHDDRLVTRMSRNARAKAEALLDYRAYWQGLASTIGEVTGGRSLDGVHTHSEAPP